MKNRIAPLASLVLALAIGAAAHAQSSAPADWLAMGADLRVRNEYYNNSVTLNKGLPRHEQDVVRIRPRVWATVTAAPDLKLFGRLTAEPRNWLKPSFVGSYAGKKGMEWRYGLVDSLNIKWTDAFGLPLTVTVGRQDILLGDPLDWWLVMDGTPNDGSWSIFFDAVRLTHDAAAIQTKFDLIFIRQNRIPDSHFPTIGPSDIHTLSDQNERGLILYASNKSLADAQVDGYYIYKGDRKPGARGTRADIHTLGGKVTGAPAGNLRYSLEAAYQFGDKTDRVLGTSAKRDIRAWGAKGKLSYLFNDELKNQVNLHAEYLSGDDPATADDEMFDVLWGRWPLWSELYIYSYIYESGGRIGQMNNLFRIGPSWSFAPVTGMTASLAYNAVFALERTPTRALVPAVFSNDGRFRAHFVQAVVKHRFNAHLSGHLWGEWMWQGDYYAQRHRMSFIRAELVLTF